MIQFECVVGILPKMLATLDTQSHSSQEKRFGLVSLLNCAPMLGVASLCVLVEEASALDWEHVAAELSNLSSPHRTPNVHSLLLLSVDTEVSNLGRLHETDIE